MPEPGVPGFLLVYEHMLTGFASEPGSFEKQAIYTAQMRISRLKDIQRAAVQEIAFWERILTDLTPCPTCKGTGNQYEPTGDDSSRRLNCNVCGGSATSRANRPPGATP